MNPPQNPMKTVLFLCTGNYYRSRYAEIVFNWLAQKQGLAWKADSRGLDPDPRNPGPMSRDTMAALRKLGVPFDSYLRFPQLVAELLPADFKDRLSLAVVELLHRNFRDEQAEIQLGQFVQQAIGLSSISLVLGRLLDSDRPGLQHITPGIFVQVVHDLNSVQAPAAGHRAHDEFQHLVETLLDAGIVLVFLCCGVSRHGGSLLGSGRAHGSHSSSPWGAVASSSTRRRSGTTSGFDFVPPRELRLNFCHSSQSVSIFLAKLWATSSSHPSPR